MACDHWGCITNAIPRWVRRLSKVFAIIVSVVFALMPIYIYLRG